MNDEIRCIAKAYLQGALDATPVRYRHSTDIWYEFGEYDIHVEGSDHHGFDEDTLFVYVYRHGRGKPDDYVHKTSDYKTPIYINAES